MEALIEGTMYGDLYRGYNVWRLTLRVKCMETHIDGTIYGDSYISYNVWSLIRRVH